MDTINKLRIYTKMVWEADDIIELRPLPVDKGKRRWVVVKELLPVIEEMIEENKRGANIYAGILPRNKVGGGKAEDVDGGYVLWLDFDHCEPVDALYIINKLNMPDPTMVVNSGHGAHVFWRLKEWTNKDTIHKTLINMIEYLLTTEEAKSYIDKSAKDPARILRLPGFINHKPPVVNAEIWRHNEDNKYSIEDFSSFVVERKAPVGNLSDIPMVSNDDNLVERARRYLAMIPGSAKGGRTNTAFRAAAAMVNDFRLSPSDALPLLEAWDRASHSPTIAQDYGPDELQKIINNAIKYAKKSPGCLNAPIVTSSPETEEKEEASPCPEFNDELLNVPGFIGEVMNYTLETSHRKQPVLALSAAIALQSVLAGRKVADEWNTRTNVYILALAPSGAGKDRPRAVNDIILTDAECDNLIGAEDFASDTGIITAVSQNPATLFQGDEIGEALKSMSGSKNDHKKAIPSLLMKLYSQASGIYRGKAYADSSKRKEIINPCVTIYGTSVPGNVFDGLTIDQLTNGFFSRLIIFESKNYSKPNKPNLKEVPISILEAAMWWNKFDPMGNLAVRGISGEKISRVQPHIIPYTEEAQAIQHDLESIVEKKLKTSDPAGQAIWARAVEKARKLALIYACSEDYHDLKVSASAASWGCNLAQCLTDKMICDANDWIHDGEFDKIQKKVIRDIKKSNNRLPFYKMKNVVLKRVSIKLRDDILNNLLETGQIEIIEEEGGKKFYQVC